MIGIYKITNQYNGKIYIGQSINIIKRWNNHKSAAFNINQSEYNYPLYQAIRKYGLHNFIFEILEECSPTELNEREQYYINYYNSYYNGYNQTPGGQNTQKSSKLTIEQVLEIQEKLLTQRYTLTMLASEYNVHSDTIRDINNGTTWCDVNPDLSFPLYISYKNSHYHEQEKICPKCGQPKNRCATLCLKCYREQIALNHPSYEQLIQDLIDLRGNMTQIGKKYGVTGNAIKKWLKKYDLYKDLNYYKAGSSKGRT